MANSGEFSFDSLFCIVTPLIRILKKGLVNDAHKYDEALKQIHGNLESISAKSKQILDQIHIHTVNETMGKYEEYIKHQYSSFCTMIERVWADPNNASQYLNDFKIIYENDKSVLGLNTFYNVVIGNVAVFGRPLFEVYLEDCNVNYPDRKKEIMEARFSHIAHLFHIGLIALMAYYTITKDDLEEVKEKWDRKFQDIQGEMQEVLHKLN